MGIMSLAEAEWCKADKVTRMEKAEKELGRKVKEDSSCVSHIFVVVCGGDRGDRLDKLMDVGARGEDGG
eukprot:1362268-Ditylum_brightwellii.AAC.1